MGIEGDGHCPPDEPSIYPALAIVREVGAETADPGLVLQVCVRTRHRIQELLAGQRLDEGPLVAIQMHTIPRWGFGDWPAEPFVGLGQAILRDGSGTCYRGDPSWAGARLQCSSGGMAAWPAACLRRRDAAGEAPGSVGILPAAGLRALRQKHRTSHEIHGIHIWALLVFEVWFRTWMNGHRVA